MALVPTRGAMTLGSRLILVRVKPNFSLKQLIIKPVKLAADKWLGIP
jgi:hypothetical protein